MTSPTDAMELSDAECDARIMQALNDAHEGPFVALADMPAEMLWSYYRAIYRAGRSAGTGEPPVAYRIVISAHNVDKRRVEMIDAWDYGNGLHAKAEQARRHGHEVTPLFGNTGGASTEAAARRETAAWRDVRAERGRQVRIEGWSPEHDDEHDQGALPVAAAAYALRAASHAATPQWRETYLDFSWQTWPFDGKWFKPTTARRDLVKAGALILAEIDRLDRAVANLAAAPEEAGSNKSYSTWNAPVVASRGITTFQRKRLRPSCCT